MRQKLWERCRIDKTSDRFVSDPNEIVKVEQVVKVKVLEVNQKSQRIGLSLKV